MKLLTPAEEEGVSCVSVQRGESIEDPSKAMLAVEYARRYRRVAEWLAIGLLVIGILGGAVALIQRRLAPFGLGGVFDRLRVLFHVFGLTSNTLDCAE